MHACMRVCCGYVCACFERLGLTFEELGRGGCRSICDSPQFKMTLAYLEAKSRLFGVFHRI